jgi:hypothetical protein
MATRGAREEMQDGGRMQEREHGLLCNMHLSHHTILRSDANVPRSTYLRNSFRAAILYANFYLCSIKINALQQLRKQKKLRLMLWPHDGSQVPLREDGIPHGFGPAFKGGLGLSNS